MLLRDANGDGQAELRSLFLANLHSPFGMALVGGSLYVANADAIVRFPYTPGQQQISARPVKLTDLPAGINHHWTKGLVASPDGRKLYVSVGSNSNAAENGMEIEQGRAAIWEVDVATGNKRLFASGLRNPVGIAFEPQTRVLWTVVNERDELGSDLVPDYLTSVREGGFYGWPWSRWGSPSPMAVCRRRLPTAPSSASTAPGTGGRTAATRWCSCPSPMAGQPGRRRTC
jgi:glucose/arabinose dehydrogenase